MCHTIESHNNFFLKLDNFLVGIKEIGHNWIELFPPYINKNYTITKYNGFYCLSAPVKKQDVIFKFNTKNYRKKLITDYIAKKIKINTSIHILSFLRNTVEYIYVGYKEVMIPVLFNNNDVLFWDGNVVSVKKFFLPNEKMIKKILKETELFIYDENFIDDYKLFLEIVEEQFKKQASSKKNIKKK